MTEIDDIANECIEFLKNGIKETPALKEYLDQMVEKGLDEDMVMNLMIYQSFKKRDEMIEYKRFQIDGMHVRDLMGIIPSTIWQIDEFKEKYCDELNKMHDENLQLKEENQSLKQSASKMMEYFERTKYVITKEEYKGYNELKELLE